MKIQINTGSQVELSAQKMKEIEEAVTAGMERFSDKITRIELHLVDENSSAKGGPDDKRCRIEARPAGMKPTEVTHKASTIQFAVDGALDKLERALETAFEKQRKY